MKNSTVTGFIEVLSGILIILLAGAVSSVSTLVPYNSGIIIFTLYIIILTAFGIWKAIENKPPNMSKYIVSITGILIGLIGLANGVLSLFRTPLQAIIIPFFLITAYYLSLEMIEEREDNEDSQ